MDLESDVASDSCGTYRDCTSCMRGGKCNWCENTNRGNSCQLAAECTGNLVTDKANCPAAGAGTVLRNVSSLMAGMLLLVIVLNVINRWQNRRRNNKLKKSIFTLPCYVYPSREKRAAAMKEARSGLQESPDDARESDLEEQRSEGEASDGSSPDSPPCTICLSTFQNDEVIKVLPCGHDFHSECLDSWLQLKAMCPLCKAPAFVKTKNGRQRRHSFPHHSHGQPRIHVVDSGGQSAQAGTRPRRRGLASFGSMSFIGAGGSVCHTERRPADIDDGIAVRFGKSPTPRDVTDGSIIAAGGQRWHEEGIEHDRVEIGEREFYRDRGATVAEQGAPAAAVVMQRNEEPGERREAFSAGQVSVGANAGDRAGCAGVVGSGLQQCGAGSAEDTKTQDDEEAGTIAVRGAGLMSGLNADAGGGPQDTADTASPLSTNRKKYAVENQARVENSEQAGAVRVAKTNLNDVIEVTDIGDASRSVEALEQAGEEIGQDWSDAALSQAVSSSPRLVAVGLEY